MEILIKISLISLSESLKNQVVLLNTDTTTITFKLERSYVISPNIKLITKINQQNINKIENNSSTREDSIGDINNEFTYEDFNKLCNHQVNINEQDQTKIDRVKKMNKLFEKWSEKIPDEDLKKLKSYKPKGEVPSPFDSFSIPVLCSSFNNGKLGETFIMIQLEGNSNSPAYSIEKFVDDIYFVFSIKGDGSKIKSLIYMDIIENYYSKNINSQRRRYKLDYDENQEKFQASILMDGEPALINSFLNKNFLSKLHNNHIDITKFPSSTSSKS